MPLQGDEISLGEQVEDREADRRLEWQRPTLDRLVAGGAEVGRTPVTEGGFYS
jgi:hypothetical protein